MRFSKYVLAAFAALSVWSGSAAAQCPAPDGLDGGPCCAVTMDHVPAFPNFNQPAIEICWLDCNVNSVINHVARWKFLPLASGIPGTPPQNPCGERFASLDMRIGGVTQWLGTLRLQYSRTWMETHPSGQPLQVWRFLVNGDMKMMMTTPVVPCPVPACATQFKNVRFTGYLDVAGGCVAPTTYQYSWMLNHACDAIDHQPGFPRGGAFHPNRSYTFVGPSAGFIPGPLQPLEGTPGSPIEAMRRRDMTTTPVLCNFEERAIFNLASGGTFCMCGAPPTQQWHLGNLTVNGSCGSSVTTSGGPFLPGFLSMGIGAWTIPAVFPGAEQVRWNAGNYNRFEACTGVLSNDVYYGATTINGYPAFQVNTTGVIAVLPPTFIDQSNSLRLPAGVGVLLNMPYISDHFLNLNH